MINNITIKRQQVLGVLNINPIPKDTLVFPEDTEFKYYFEPKPNEALEEKRYWPPYKKVVYTINSDGLNERYEYSPVKTKDTFRIITIGDSHTFGHYVNIENNFPEQLENLLNKKI